jgi:hypothetical protein
MHFPDLGATVLVGSAPQDLADELPSLYHCLFSTMDWFLTEGGAAPNGVCLLEEPRHHIFFRHIGRRIEVLNKGFRCEPTDAHRVCTALFRAFPEVRYLHLDVMFPPAALRFPCLVRERLDRMVIDLPGSVDDYYRSLRKSTRKNVRRHQNQLAREVPGLKTEVVSPGERSQELIDRLVAWKTERFHRKGMLTYWDFDHRSRARIAELLSRRGQVLLASVEGEEVGIQLTFRVGDTAYAFLSAVDPRFEPYSLGFLMFYWLTCHAIESGAKRLDALETFESSKGQLGALPVRVTSLSVFRSWPDLLWSQRELRSIARQRYWLARHEAGERLRRSPRGKKIAALVTKLRRVRLDAEREMTRS